MKLDDNEQALRFNDDNDDNDDNDNDDNDEALRFLVTPKHTSNVVKSPNTIPTSIILGCGGSDGDVSVGVCTLLGSIGYHIESDIGKEHCRRRRKNLQTQKWCGITTLGTSCRAKESPRSRGNSLALPGSTKSSRRALGTPKRIQENSSQKERGHRRERTHMRGTPSKRNL
eukprot:gene3961-biopygen12325